MGVVLTGGFSAFLDKVLNFLGVGLALYTLANVYGWVSKDSIIHQTVKCKYCRKTISDKVGVFGVLCLQEGRLMVTF